MEQTHTENSTNSRCSESVEEVSVGGPKLSDASSVKIRRNNVTTRVAAKPPSMISATSSDFVCDESSPSTSSVTPLSANNSLATERRSDCGQVGGPSYMSLTKSAKARLSGYGSHKPPLQRQRSGDLLHHNNRMAFSSIDVQSTAGSEVSVTSKRLNSLALKGRATRSLDKENERRPSSLL
jgi:hypothetical protein